MFLIYRKIKEKERFTKVKRSDIIKIRPAAVG